MENEYWEYLAVGGELHGKIYEGLARRSHVDLPIEDRRLSEFLGSTAAAKVTQRPTVEHKVHIHKLNGEKYAIAYLEPDPTRNALDTNQLESLIVSSNLKPI